VKNIFLAVAQLLVGLANMLAHTFGMEQPAACSKTKETYKFDT
jgi:hypothetical protein